MTDSENGSQGGRVAVFHVLHENTASLMRTDTRWNDRKQKDEKINVFCVEAKRRPVLIMSGPDSAGYYVVWAATQSGPLHVEKRKIKQAKYSPLELPLQRNAVRPIHRKLFCKFEDPIDPTVFDGLCRELQQLIWGGVPEGKQSASSSIR